MKGIKVDIVCIKEGEYFVLAAISSLNSFSPFSSSSLAIALRRPLVDALVSFEVSGLAECLGTAGAGVGPMAAVDLLVGLQVAKPTEALATLRAAEGPLTTVDLFVGLEHTSVAEALAALQAGEGPAVVAAAGSGAMHYLQMVAIGCLLGEALGAMCAGVGPLIAAADNSAPAVAELVRLELAGPGKALAAGGAHKRPLAGVQSLVRPQVVGLGEALSTVGARVGLATRVY